MITKTYKVKIISSKVRSDFREEVSPPLSDLYLNKEQGWINLSCEENTNLKKYTVPNLLEKKTYKDYTVFKTNTLNFDLTDKFYEGTPYKYLIVNGDSYTLSKLQSLLNTRDIVKIGSNYYTNTLCYSKDNKIYTENLYTLEDCIITYRSNFIEIQAPRGVDILFKKSILTPHFINEYQAYIPSFYLQLPDKIIRCVDSNITFNKELEETDHPSYPLKGLQKGASKALSLIFEPKEYSSILSTHCFSLPLNKTTLYIQNNGTITTKTKSELYFEINKEINLDKINIIPNRYKKLSYETNIDDYVFNTIYSHKETNSKLNSAYKNYKSIINPNPEHIYVHREGKDIKMISFNSEIKERPYLKTFKISDKSYNDHPSLFDEISKDNLKTLDGVKFIEGV